MRGKLIVIEGTDCSGKETQAKLLVERLNKMNISAKYFSFPNYDTPTGKIIGACYLGQENLSKSLLNGEEGWFKEGSSKVDGLVSSLYYAADRKYNIEKIEEMLANGTHVILDRYTFSNMAHQGGKITSQEKRFQFFKKIELLEFELLELPRPDTVFLLYVPYQLTLDLQKNRQVEPDQNEKDKKYLKRAEQTYLELRALYHFQLIECCRNNYMRSIDDIHEEIFKKIENCLTNVKE